MEDNATHLAYKLRNGAIRLKMSRRTEEAIIYKPLSGINQTYTIEINQSEMLQPPFGYGDLRVVDQNGKMSFTTYHRRFVFVPQRLYIVKTNSETKIVLRKNGPRIEIVELR
jgi:hypothetical protein